MIKRELANTLLEDAKTSPVIAIFGPRQSGKTTLAQATFAQHEYVSLEDFDVRTFASEDPRGFLAKYENEHGVILDEVQHVPTILSYIQTRVDANRRPGYYILTGSQNFLLNEAVTQSLAGRVSFHTLLPLSLPELQTQNLLPQESSTVIFQGLYPIIYGRNENPVKWYVDYTKSYLERDVRTLSQVSDLTVFKKFMQLCAGRTGQLVNRSSLGDDLGVSYNTVDAWLSILEASYIIFFLHPHHRNFNKRLTKSSKFFFHDTGLACSLLGIESESQLSSHYLRGGLFENLVISELFKSYYNADKNPHLYFWRDKTGNEIDCLIERGEDLYPIEIKSGQTINSDYFDSLTKWNELADGNPKNSFVVYGGRENQERKQGNIVSWVDTSDIFRKLYSAK